MSKVVLTKVSSGTQTGVAEGLRKSEVLLTDGPTQELLEKMRDIIKSGKGEEGGPTVHVRFHVSVDGTIRSHPNGGTNRTPRLATSLIDMPSSPRFTRQHLPFTVKVLEDFEGGAVWFDGVDIGKAGTQLKLMYSFVDHAGEVIDATAPVTASAGTI